MRVTNTLIADRVTSNLLQQTEQLSSLQTMISSGKRINSPSDDPIGMTKVLSYRQDIASIEQYCRNIDYGNSWLSLTETTLGSIETLLLSAQEIVAYQATGTATESTRQIAAEEIANIYDQIIALANTQAEGRYIFSGYQTQTAPFSRDDDFNAVYSGDSGEVRIIIGQDASIGINVDGQQVFNDDIDVFDVLKTLKDALESNDGDLIAEQTERLDQAYQQVVEQRSAVGERLNRLELSENYWSDVKLNRQEMLAATEDADIVQALTDLQTLETAYEAALAVSATLMQSSLIDFLR